MRQQCKNAQINIKWANGKWGDEKSKRGRDFGKVVDLYRKSPYFRMLIIYEMPDDWSYGDYFAPRVRKLLYADKYKIETFF